MANSSVIDKIKNKVVKEMIKDELITKVIDSTIPFKNAESLINTRIFNYNKNPFTITDTITFVTILVQIPRQYTMRGDNTYVPIEVEVWIISHDSRMIVNDIPKISSNRNDYLSKLLDKKFNGRSDFGIGKLVLDLNVEGSFQNDYLYRHMVFKTHDLNESLCEVEG